MEQTTIKISDSLKDYLIQTYEKLEQNDPDYPLLVEFGELINKIDTDDFLPYLKEIAEQETEYIKNGIIEDEDGDGKGFFVTLLDSIIDAGISGLGRVNFRHFIHKLNRVNPATVSARAAFRTLISLNFGGYATKIKQHPDVYQKVIDLYVRRLSGKADKIKHAIETGAKKKPLFARNLHGTEELGSLNLKKYFSAAKKYFNEIKNWLTIAEKRHILRRTRDYKHPNPHPQPRIKHKTYRVHRISPIAALRTLISLNLFGYASRIKRYPEVYTKVIKLYVQNGGKAEDIKKAIEIGAKKRPFFARLHGTEGELGVVPVTALLSVAGSFFEVIKKWLGIAEKKSNSHNSHNAQQNIPKQSNYPVQPSYSVPPTNPIKQTYPSGTKMSISPQMGGSNKKYKLIAAIGVGGILTAGFYLLNKNKKKEHKTLTGIKLN